MTTPAGADRIELLLFDYEQAREEERHFQTVQTSVIALCLTTITLLGGLAFTVGKTTAVPDFILAGAPLIALVPFAMIQHVGAQAVMRSFYLRALERTIRDEASVGDLSAYRRLPPISYSETTLALTSLSTNSTRTLFSSLHTLVAVIFPAALVVFGGLVVYLAFQVHAPWRLLMLGGYGTVAVALLVMVIRMNVVGRENFAKYVEILLERQRESLLPRIPAVAGACLARGRTATSYFLLPRPDDLVKGFFLLAGALGATFAVNVPDLNWWDLLNVAVLWFGSEYLVYQARYQWNDIVGRHEDVASPLARERGRLPSNPPGLYHVSWIVILVRLYLLVVLCTIPFRHGAAPFHLTRAAVLSVVLYFSLAVVYEALRRRLRRKRQCSRTELGTVLGVVGLGYPARFMVGWLALGGPLDLDLLRFSVAMWALGIAFVSLTWLIEGVGYYYFSNGLLVARKEGSDPSAKPHLPALLDHLGVARPSDVAEPSSAAERNWQSGETLEAAKVFTFRLFVPWTFGLALWFVALGPLNLRFTGLYEGRGDVALWGSSLVAALVVLQAPGSVLTRVILSTALVVSTQTVLVALGEPAPSLHEDGPAAATSLLILMTPLMVYMTFHGMSYQKSRGILEKVQKCLRTAATTVYRLASGE